MSHVVIVGAGPVGLWTALQIKKRRPEWDVVLYERHAQYQRSHALRLDHWSLLLYGRTSRNPREQQFYQELTGKSLTRVVANVTSSVFIRTNDLEQSLRSYAVSLGINIHELLIDHPEHVMALHPECEMFIAADGAHSKMRTSLLGEDAVKTYPLQHIVEAKFEVNCPVDRQPELLAQYHARKLDHLAFEYAGKPKHGKTPITIRVFLNKALYDIIPEATFKQPLTLVSSGVPEALHQTLKDYLHLRGMWEHCDLHDIKLTKLALSLYCAKSFAVKREDKGWFLVGDAAMGVPYFKALNCGLILGSRLGQILCSENWPIKGKLSRKIFFYNVHRPMHIATEFTVARGKDSVLTVLKSFKKLHLKALK